MGAGNGGGCVTPPWPFWGLLGAHGGVGIGNTPRGPPVVESSDKRRHWRVTFVFVPLECSHFQFCW